MERAMLLLLLYAISVIIHFGGLIFYRWLYLRHDRWRKSEYVTVLVEGRRGCGLFPVACFLALCDLPFCWFLLIQ